MEHPPQPKRETQYIESKERFLEELVGITMLIDRVNTQPPWTEIHKGGWSQERILAEFLPLFDYTDPLFIVQKEQRTVVGLIAGHSLPDFLPELDKQSAYKIAQHTSEMRSFYIRDILVAPSHWNTGEGAKLEHRLYEFAKAQGYQIIVTRTHPKNEAGGYFYRALGYYPLFYITRKTYKMHRVYFMRRVKKNAML